MSGRFLSEGGDDALGINFPALGDLQSALSGYNK